jgi:signal transduction histidine kinase
MQIRSRLTIQFIAIVAGILLLSLYFIYFKFRQITENEFYDHLRSKALMTSEMVLRDTTALKKTPESKGASEHKVLPFRENIAIYTVDGLKKIFAFNLGTDPIRPSELLLLMPGEERRFFSDGRYRLGLRRSYDHREYLVSAESEFDATDLLRLRNILIITFFIGIGAVALGGFFYAGQALSPVTSIVNQVEKILPSDLSARLKAPDSNDEIGRVSLTFNRLLDRIQFAFNMQKGFISNVSHELKNPLSVIISQLEVALDKNRTEEAYRATLTSVLEDTRELGETAEKLLQLARIHSESSQMLFERVRLDELLLQSRTALLRRYPAYHIAFDLVGEPENEDQLCVRANEPLLRLALLNLMDNGCKFSPDHRVTARIFFDPNGKHRVEISDHGPGIPEKDLQLIFQPFYRSTQTAQVRGSGIGLSLVDSILRLHKIVLHVVSSQSTGTTMQLEFGK